MFKALGFKKTSPAKRGFTNAPKINNKNQINSQAAPQSSLQTQSPTQSSAGTTPVIGPSSAPAGMGTHR